MKNINYYLLLLLISCTTSIALQAQPYPRDSFEISGRVLASAGQPMPNVVVTLVGPLKIWADTTDANGLYAFQKIPEKEDYYLQFAKDGAPTNGLNHYDMILMQRDVLYLGILNPFGYYGGDLNGNYGISTLDIVLAYRFILGLDDGSSRPKWSFLYTYTDFNPENPGDVEGNVEKYINTYPINGLNSHLQNIDFVGLKRGDANLTADPFE